ncbi:MAG: cytochrome c oxidase accessory protein CcoG [Cyclobacteriaceae bacterium]|nr:cytochrome c oxidase accessory protein CcoG [Cyclobacteriaceae bacterium]
MKDFYEYDEEYRDTLATVDEQGKRIWVYPKKPKGKFHNKRIVVTIILLTIFFSGPFIKIGGHPFLLLNILERKFVIFGQAFWPQDFFLFALTLVVLFVFIILFTIVFGRIWCGWACPQTLFMEMVFRKIEYWIEGDAKQQIKLNKSPWNTSKVLKKGVKHLIYFVISILISHTVMTYIIGVEQTINIISEPPSDNFSGFLGIMFFTGIFYWVFAFFREQACVVVCPYGRLQGVLLIKNSIVVAYDWLRGEPRGKINKKNKTEEDKGDCIDCKLCIHVCPTGIDIRNGTQLECVNCTACIDVCDDVMEKIGRPKGLIRFSSFNAIKEGITKIFNARVIGYSIVLIALVTLLSFFVGTRSDVQVTILKVPGQLYQTTDDNRISNLYNIEFVNKTFEDKNIILEIESEKFHAELTQVGVSEIFVPASELYKGVFFIKIPKHEIKNSKNVLTVVVYSEGKIIDRIDTKFLGPVALK